LEFAREYRNRSQYRIASPSDTTGDKQGNSCNPAIPSWIFQEATMRKKILYTILAAVILCILSIGASAGMQSSNYEITTSVLSGGGAAMTSENYDVNITAAQPSPIRETGTPPESDNYVLYPGFWYTLEAAPQKSKAMPWLQLLLDDE
jgi:hypothetical protein